MLPSGENKVFTCMVAKTPGSSTEAAPAFQNRHAPQQRTYQSPLLVKPQGLGIAHRSPAHLQNLLHFMASCLALQA